MTTTDRDWDQMHIAVGPDMSREQRMQAFVDAVWSAASDHRVSWVGFYLACPEALDEERLVLGPRRDKPACSPIGLHGACGRALMNRRALIVTDVANLGERYIACDPRDKSELVIPMFDADGTAWGVLDLDSWHVSAFSRTDAAALMRRLHACDLTDQADTPIDVV